VRAATLTHEVGGELRQLAEHVTHTPACRTDTQLIALAFYDEFNVPAGLGEFGGNLHSL
jgi:hypothetical protein